MVRRGWRGPRRSWSVEVDRPQNDYSVRVGLPQSAWRCARFPFYRCVESFVDIKYSRRSVFHFSQARLGRSILTQSYTSTGITGLDALLNRKGIPRGNSVLISGGPGSGKTTFAIQYLVHGAVEHDQPGLYVSLDEDPDDIKINMLNFGWDLARLEDEIRLLFINVSPVRSGAGERSGLMQLGMKEFKLVRLLEAIKEGIEEIQAKRLVIDPVTMFMLQYPDDEERTHALRDLIAGLKETDCTQVFVSELRGTGIERKYQFEEYLAQGVILLRTYQKEGKIIRILQVEKMRGVNIDPQPRPYDITSEGIVVFPDLPVFN